VRHVDIIRTSASRFEMFKASTESWRKRLDFSGTLRWIVNDDALDMGGSRRCLEWAREEGDYDLVRGVSPPRGQEASLDWLWLQAESEYVLSIEDDWFLLERIDLDRICDLMDRRPDINQVGFFKRPLERARSNGFIAEEEEVEPGLWLTTTPYWSFLPSVCRLSFLREKWPLNRSGRFFGPVNWRFQEVLFDGSPMSPPTPEWVKAHMGTYFQGGIDCGTPGDPRTGLVVQHLGTAGWSARAPEGLPAPVKYPYRHPNLYYGDLFLRPEES
jgi:hypothetical protein